MMPPDSSSSMIGLDTRRDGVMRDELESTFNSLNLDVIPTFPTHHALSQFYIRLSLTLSIKIPH